MSAKMTLLLVGLLFAVIDFAGLQVVVHKVQQRVSDMFPACQAEDGPGPCTWDARHQGNGRGDSFWIDSGQQVHYYDGRSR